LNNKLKEHGLDEDVKVHIIPLGRENSRLVRLIWSFVNVTHSIPEPVRSDQNNHGTVFHSGDWKIDRTPTLARGWTKKRLAEIGNEGVDALVCDSPMCCAKDFTKRKRCRRNHPDIVKHAKGRVAITTFASMWSASLPPCAPPG
jgi:ribonuclease J